MSVKRAEFKRSTVPTVFDAQKRNTRQRKAALVGMRVAKVETRARKAMWRNKAQRGLFTGIAALQDMIGRDLLTRANRYRKEGQMLDAIHVALALREEGCLATRYIGNFRIGGINLPPPKRIAEK